MVITNSKQNFCVKAESFGNKILIPVTVFTSDEKQVECKALIDTGSNISAISQTFLKCNKLTWSRNSPAIGLSGEFVFSKVYKAGLLIADSILIIDSEFHSLPIVGAEVLIGMDILSNGDFAFSHKDGNWYFSFRKPTNEQMIDLTK